MAAVEHPIFGIFRENALVQNQDVRDVIDVQNNVLYLFDVETGDILVTHTAYFIGAVSVPDKFQVFRPRVRIYGNPRALRASHNHIKVAVMTDLGLYIVYLPHLWPRIMVSTTTADCISTCHVWMVNPEMKDIRKTFIYDILQARWHPREHDLILVLYNDNYLRLVDTDKRILLRAVSLGRHPCGLFSTIVVLNEHTRDFDFASSTRREEGTPVFLLTGNGDISYAVVAKEGDSRVDKPMSFKSPKPEEDGPRTILSPLSNACSMIVLQCQPTVIAVCCISGMVSHCIVLGEGRSQYLKVFEDFNLNSEEAGNRQGLALLKKDPASSYRYCVLHASGLHCVMVAVIPLLENCLTQDMQESLEVWQVIQNISSIVRQVLDTHLPRVSDPRPPWGLGVIPVRITTSKLLVFLADCQAIVINLDQWFPQIEDFITRYTAQARKPFSGVVSDFLRGSETTRQPVFKLGNAQQEAPSVATLEFLRSHIANLKEDRIVRQKAVLELMDNKVSELVVEYYCQKKQLESLNIEKQELKRNAEKIAERYEEINEKNGLYEKRLEMASLRLRTPVRTVAEERMKTELVELKEKTDQLKIGLRQLQAFYEHRREQGPSTSQERTRPVYLSEQRSQTIKQTLEAMNENIEVLKVRVLRLLRRRQ